MLLYFHNGYFNYNLLKILIVFTMKKSVAKTGYIQLPLKLHSFTNKTETML